MTGKRSRKEVPSDIALITENLDKFDDYATRRLLDRPMWRDFIDQHLRETGDTARVAAALAEPPGAIIPTVMKHVLVPLGGHCRLIKCPVTRQPSVCALCPIETRAGERLICSGPTVQRERRTLTLSTRTVYDREWDKRSCPYSISRLDGYDRDADDGLQHLLELVYPVLQRHPDYETVDYRAKYAAELEEAGIS